MSEPGLVVLHRWRLDPGQEGRFVEAWSVVTRALLEQGSLGSRLHRGDDGLWYAYERWPNAETRSAAVPQGPEVAEARRAMEEAVAVHFPAVMLEPVADHSVGRSRSPAGPIPRLPRHLRIGESRLPVTADMGGPPAPFTLSALEGMIRVLDPTGTIVHSWAALPGVIRVVHEPDGAVVLDILGHRYRVDPDTTTVDEAEAFVRAANHGPDAGRASRLR